MDKIWKCLTHDRVTEIYCESCRTYICLECLSDHDTQCTDAKYIHVFKHAEKFTLPKIDQLIVETGTSDLELNKEADELAKSLNEITPELKRVTLEHVQSIQVMGSLSNQLDAMIKPMKFQPIADQMRIGLTADKRRLETALKSDNMEAVITLTKKITGEAEITKKENLEKHIIGKIKASIPNITYGKHYKELIETLQALAIRCQRLRLSGYMADWKCDRKYFGRKMTLSEDGLTYGNSAGDGYPAIIGDTPIEMGVCMFEVIPSGLNCNGKEGFGIVELEVYKAAYASSPETPAVHDQMIGFMYSTDVHNMTAVQSAAMVMDKPYVVKVDMNTLTMTIKGQGVLFTATLKPDKVYVPCFSLGCTGNKLQIKLLSTDDD